MARGLSLVAGVAAALLMLHATFSAMQFREFAKISEKPADLPLPTDIVVEVVLGIVAAAVAIFAAPGKFKPIDIRENYNARSYTQFHNRSDLMMFNHRGRALASRGRATKERAEARGGR